MPVCGRKFRLKFPLPSEYVFGDSFACCESDLSLTVNITGQNKCTAYPLVSRLYRSVPVPRKVAVLSSVSVTLSQQCHASIPNLHQWLLVYQPSVCQPILEHQVRLCAPSSIISRPTCFSSSNLRGGYFA